MGLGSVSAGTANTPVNSPRRGNAHDRHHPGPDSSNPSPKPAPALRTHRRQHDLTSTSITSVVFSSNGYQAEITGTGKRDDRFQRDYGQTPVTFTLTVSSGGGAYGRGYSLPSANISITGTGINYQQSASVSNGSISVNATTAGTTRLPSTGRRRRSRRRARRWGGGGGPVAAGRLGWRAVGPGGSGQAARVRRRPVPPAQVRPARVTGTGSTGGTGSTARARLARVPRARATGCSTPRRQFQLVRLCSGNELEQAPPPGR